MMKFWYSKYELTPWNSIGAVAGPSIREGALVKVEWPNGVTGYSDLYPWPELGDEPVDSHIEYLQKGRLTILMEQSIWLAKKDAQLRSLGKSAFAGIPKVKNHYLINDFTKFSDEQLKEAKSAGFTTFKIKAGRAVDEEGKYIAKFIKQNSLLVRVDFNAKIDFSEYERFISHLGPAEKARIEYVEDPIEWDLEAWTEISEMLPLAIDQEFDKVKLDQITEPPPFKTLVLKPARIDMEKAVAFAEKFDLKMVVTSSLDHPVGVAHALFQASELKKVFPNRLLDCGCLSLRTYKPNEFSSQIQTAGPFLKDIRGTGIGFDALFDRIEWTPINR